ncbi:MAG: aminoacyl-tRNA hydrolase [Candidatus Eiseniibacteriota bacterium]|nr:MAG: aminoacyl-tRNA hydrolase [Candidatus Eisenbacteria bacterium]
MHCAVGLGNPGRKYKLTRHNAGFLVIEKLHGSLKCSWRRKARLYEARRCGFESTEVLLLRPLTFMNLSGAAVEAAREDFGLSLQEILVICDDASLPLGSIRFRKQGSSGGHKGLQSVIEAVGTQGFPRLRIGIGAPPSGESLEEYVLSKPDRSERRSFAGAVALAAEAVLFCFSQGLDAAASSFN